MKKLLALSLIGSSLILGSNSVKADDWDYWGIKIDNIGPNGSPEVKPDGIQIYTINSSTSEATLKKSICFNETYDNLYDRTSCSNGTNHLVDETTGNLVLDSGNGYKIYDPSTNTFSDYAAPWSDSYNNSFERPIGRIDSNGNKIIELSGRKLIE